MNKEYERLYRYCTRTKVHGAVYKEKLKKLQQLTFKLLKGKENEIQSNYR